MTSNQINYWKMRNEQIHNEAVRRETQRVNYVNEELKRIDQQLQADLNAINAKYKEKQYQLDKHDMEFSHRLSLRKADQDDKRIANDAAKIQATFQSNAINSMAQREIARSNAAREALESQKIETNRVLEQQKVDLERNMQPYRVQDYVSKAGLNRAQTNTERVKPNLVKSQTFNQYASPILNMFTGVLRTVVPALK